MWVPYSQSDAPSREAFLAKAKVFGMLGDGAPQKWRCVVCDRESTLVQIGVTFGNAAVGSPLCPEDKCTGIGWEFFTEVPES
jgi:hypothetical protein